MLKNNKIALLTLMLFAVSFSISAKTIITKNKITKVTVYPRNAVLTRTATYNVGRGEYEFVFDRLPTRVWSSSLRANVTGSGKLVLLGADIKTVYKRLKQKDEVARLKAAIDKIKEKISRLYSQRGIIEKEIDFLNSIKITAAQDINQKIALKKISTESWAKLYSFIFSKISAKTSTLFKLRSQIKKLQKERAKLSSKYYAIYRGTRKRYKRAVVRVKATTGGRCKISISYQMYGVRWYPSYNIRLSKDKKNVAVSYFATLYQKTGEDWKNIKLAFSTARPLSWRAVPKIYPWYLDFYRYRRYYRRRSKSYRGGKSRFMAKREAEKKADYSKGKLRRAIRRRSRIKSMGTAVTFVVPGRSTVKSDGTRSKKLLTVKSFPISFIYKALPHRSRTVFIEGQMKNSSKAYLLYGSARIFKNSVYIGSTRVRSLAPNALLKLFFGIEPRIKTSKELLERKLEPGSDNEWHYKYRLTVQNNQTKTVKVQLFDALPVSRNTKIEVDIKDMSRKPSSKNEKGIHRWDLTLSPGQKISITYKLKIEYPSKKKIRGLR